MRLDRTALLAAVVLSSVPAAASGRQASEDRDAIAFALSAAPPEIAARATVTDLEGNVLRRGDGPFTCLPVPGEAMCLDAAWLAWLQAYLAKKTPPAMGLGIAYMLAGDEGASNTDPFAEGPTSTHDWVVSGPHIMVIVPDGAALDALPTDPATGGPFVMWKGTPYAHVMVPVPGRSN